MKQLPAILFLVPFLLSCSADHEEIGVDGCAQNQICTEVYKSISIELKNQEGAPYSLDDYFTVKKSTGEKIVLNASADITNQQKYGTYPVFDDGHMNQTTKAGLDFEFTGIKDGKIVITQIFTIGHDCCHVELKRGETKVVVSE